MFWIFGLILCLWVGPAQSSSRSFLARLAPVGREGQMFGLYATTGRAASFLAPGLFALFSGLFSDRVGIVGIAAGAAGRGSGADSGQAAAKRQLQLRIMRERTSSDSRAGGTIGRGIEELNHPGSQVTSGSSFGG